MFKSLTCYLNDSFDAINESIITNEFVIVYIVIYRTKTSKFNYTINLMCVPNNVNNIQTYVEDNRNKSINELQVIPIGHWKRNETNYKLVKLIDKAHVIAKNNIKKL